MRMTSLEYLQYESKRQPKVVAPSDAVQRESKLHDEILAHCASQWPRWKCIHSRMDKATGQEIGTPDFCILLPDGELLLAECKAKGGKLSAEQRNWHHEAAKLGYKVWTLYNMADFLHAVKFTMA